MLKHSLRERGDTIVEVLLAIAIVSFVLVAAYITVNKNTLINQDTQERSQALQLATTQLEFLHNGSAIGTNNCFDATGNPVGSGSIGAPSNAPCVVTSAGQPAGAGVQPAYTIAVTNASGNYQVNVTWDSLVSTTQDHITLFYQP